MTLEQALQILLKTLVMREGLSLQEAADTVTAWNVLVNTATKPAQNGIDDKKTR